MHMLELLSLYAHFQCREAFKSILTGGWLCSWQT